MEDHKFSPKEIEALMEINETLKRMAESSRKHSEDLERRMHNLEKKWASTWCPQPTVLKPLPSADPVQPVIYSPEPSKDDELSVDVPPMDDDDEMTIEKPSLDLSTVQLKMNLKVSYNDSILRTLHVDVVMTPSHVHVQNRTFNLYFPGVCENAPMTFPSDSYLLWGFTEILSTLNLFGFGKPPPRPPDICSGLLIYYGYLIEVRQSAHRHHIPLYFASTLMTTEHKHNRLKSYPRSLPCWPVSVLTLRISKVQGTEHLDYQLSVRVESDSSVCLVPLMDNSKNDQLVTMETMEAVDPIEDSNIDTQVVIMEVMTTLIKKRGCMSGFLCFSLTILMARNEFKVNGESFNRSSFEALSNWIVSTQHLSFNRSEFRVEINHNWWNLFIIFPSGYWTYSLVRYLCLKYSICFSQSLISHGDLVICMESYKHYMLHFLVKSDSKRARKDMSITFSEISVIICFDTLLTVLLYQHLRMEVICKSLTAHLIWWFDFQDIPDSLEIVVTDWIIIWMFFYQRSIGKIFTTSKVDNGANQWSYIIILFTQVWMLIEICSDSLMIQVHAQRVSICFFGWMVFRECDLCCIALCKRMAKGCMLIYHNLVYTEVAQRLYDELSSKHIGASTAMVFRYSISGKIEAARSISDQMIEKDLVCWSALIVGYAESEHPQEALKLFYEMQRIGAIPDQVTMLSVISAYAHLGALESAPERLFTVYAHMVPICTSQGYFSLPRPSEFIDLEDKVTFKGGGMLHVKD